MGSWCSKSTVVATPGRHQQEGDSSLHMLFNRIDKDNKGYISIEDLNVMIQDDSAHLKGKDANEIMEKYGTDGKMAFSNFDLWWHSTYTAYHHTDHTRIAQVADQHEGFSATRPTSKAPTGTGIGMLEPIPEVPDNASAVGSRSSSAT